jgi:hypothetical protein
MRNTSKGAINTGPMASDPMIATTINIPAAPITAAPRRTGRWSAASDATELIFVSAWPASVQGRDGSAGNERSG